jgi:hypothetical protein
MKDDIHLNEGGVRSITESVYNTNPTPMATNTHTMPAADLLTPSKQDMLLICSWLMVYK